MIARFKKIEYYQRIVQCEEEEYLENYEKGLVNYFNNYNFFFYFITKIEKEIKKEVNVLPSFLYNSDDENKCNFKVVNLKLTKVNLNKINELLEQGKLTFKNKDYEFSYIYKNGTLSIILK